MKTLEQKGDVAMDSASFEDAVAHFSAALSLDPLSADLHEFWISFKFNHTFALVTKTAGLRVYDDQRSIPLGALDSTANSCHCLRWGYVAFAQFCEKRILRRRFRKKWDNFYPK